MDKNYKYTALSDCVDEDVSKTGYFIVDDQIHQVKKGDVLESWPVDGETPEEKVASARQIEELPCNAKIVVDDIGMFDNDIIGDYGKLLTSEEALDELDEEERDGIEDLKEYYLNH